jgi:hypothetical protein
MSWEFWGRRAESGPFGFVLWVFGGVVLLVCFMFMCLLPVGCTMNWLTSGSRLVQKETSPEPLLRKYEWFKDAAAQLDKKQADIRVYEKRSKDLKEALGNKPRNQWDRDDREALNQWATELAGVKTSYNSLAAEYNSAMAKENWRFCEVGRLPQGADRPLPREYKPYATE